MEKERIKVYLQYPWKTSDSQYYKSLVENPPKGVNYLSQEMSVGMILNKRIFKMRTVIKKYLRKILFITGISIPNIHETKTDKEYDLIHCAHCLSSNDSPWVADFEECWQMWIFGKESKKSHEKIKETLLKENCKKILAWTESSKKDILKNFPEIKDKIEIVHYAMPAPSIKKKKNKDKITLLYISRYFYNKGGLHVLEVFDILTKKYKNVEAIFISQTPEKISKEYSKNKSIKILGLLPHTQIMEYIFPSADIFVYPGYSDSFGFTFVESLAFGLPIVTIDGFARKDIIDEGKTGYVVKRPQNLTLEKIGEIEKRVINQMVAKTSLLIEDEKLRKRMSKECIKVVKNGKFSLNERNKKLKKIYEEAIT